MAQALFAVDINDKEFKRKYKRMMNKFPKAVDDAVRGTAFYGEREYRRMTPRITGQMRRGYRVKRIKEGIWKIFNKVKYALPVDVGSRPHIIRPKKGKFLYWTTTGKRRITVSGGQPSRKSISGFDHYARSVRHPGFKGHKLTKRILPMMARRLKRLLLVNFGKLKRQFA